MDEGWLNFLVASFVFLIILGLIYVLEMFVPFWVAIILGIAIVALGIPSLLFSLNRYEYFKEKSMRRKTHRRFLEKYGSQGKDIFMCCEEGGEPEEYMKKNWLPRFKDRTVFYDHKRGEENTLENDICKYWDTYLMPVVILFPREGPARGFYFLKAYKCPLNEAPFIKDMSLFQSIEKEMLEALGDK